MRVEQTNSGPIKARDVDNAPDVIRPSAGGALISIEDYRNALTKVSSEKENIAEELERTRKRVQTIEILDRLIEPYAKRAFFFMCVYCGMVAAILVLHGFNILSFSLPESVLQFLVGSTATTVIGLVGMVLTGIFVGARRNQE